MVKLGHFMNGLGVGVCELDHLSHLLFETRHALGKFLDGGCALRVPSARLPIG
jgi:hypothetical protein